MAAAQTLTGKLGSSDAVQTCGMLHLMAATAAGAHGDHGTDAATTHDTTVDPAQVDGTQMFPFLAQLHLPPGVYRAIYLTDADEPVTYLASLDGSWCEINRQPDHTGRHTVREAGPTRLWAAIETAWTQWTQLGTPAWHEFGLTATPNEHHIWHRNPHSGPHWTLPPDPLTI